MPIDKSHLSDQELLLAADGESPPRRAREAEAHLASCWSCRTRFGEIERTIASFVQSRNVDLPPAASARAQLRLRLATLAAEAQTGTWWQTHLAPLAAGAVLAILVTGYLLHSPAPVEARAIPDPYLTPGATLPVTRNDVCGADSVESRRIVPVSVARKVFAEYGINPKPRAYEVDYLITPALGGSDNIRNFWPQPYANTVWNAHIKDALEDHLRGLVCSGELELSTAQQDIARDWISAYKKYFRTENPLPKHTSFLKDSPWE
jgi:hypothetical protein